MRRGAVLAVAAAAMLAAAAGAALACGPERLERGVVARITPEGDVLLADGRALRLTGLHRPARAIVPLRPGDAVAFAGLDEPDRWSRLPALVFALPQDGDPVWLQEHLARSGKAAVRFEPALAACWPLLTAAEAGARERPDLPAEPGRFARVEGRVARVGEGRTAHFVNVTGADGERLTGIVQKRHLRRLQAGGVDVSALRGHIVRLRGVRSLRNARAIALTRPEQIEIVR
jgi:hypothetical protein